MIINSITEFRRACRSLGPGDLILGRLALKPGEEIKLYDLADRGVTCFPPALAQFLARSKAAQAEVLGEFMAPGSFVAYGLPDLAAHLMEFQTRGIESVVAKRDKAHLGLGVSLWPSLEVLYSLASLRDLSYPLVVQPFLPQARDFRVVALGDYLEAYERLNPHSFRKNLFQGGSSRTVDLSPRISDFCRRVMARGKFPYAVMDLLLSQEDQIYLSEVNLHGGLKGARLSQKEFGQKVASLEQDFRRQWEES